MFELNQSINQSIISFFHLFPQHLLELSHHTSTMGGPLAAHAKRKGWTQREGKRFIYETGLLCNIVSVVCVFISFCSPYWIVSWPRVHSGFKRIGEDTIYSVQDWRMIVINFPGETFEFDVQVTAMHDQ